MYFHMTSYSEYLFSLIKLNLHQLYVNLAFLFKYFSNLLGSLQFLRFKYYLLKNWQRYLIKIIFFSKIKFYLAQFNLLVINSRCKH